METILSYAENQSVGSSTFQLIMGVASIVGMWKMFEKAGEQGWKSLIPVYNMYTLCELVMGNGMYVFRLFIFLIPIIGWIPGFYWLFQICKATAQAYGQDPGYAWGYLFLSPVFYCMTGFSDATKYYGPFGRGDTRSSDARGAKTVNFDVVQNDTTASAQEYSRPTRVEPVVQEVKEDEVSFTVDQPEE